VLHVRSIINLFIIRSFHCRHIQVVETNVSETVLPPSSGLTFMNMRMYPLHCCLHRQLPYAQFDVFTNLVVHKIQPWRWRQHVLRNDGSQPLSYKEQQSNKSRDNSVGIALGYGLGDRGSGVRFPAGAGNFSLHHRVQNGSGSHPSSYPIGTRSSFPGVKAAVAWSWPLTSN
jgi:hypothetical protein